MQRKTSQTAEFSKNVKLYYIAVGIIILGYLILSIGGADSFTSLTLGPLILVLGYLVAIPVTLLIGVKKSETESEESETKKQDKG